MDTAQVTFSLTQGEDWSCQLYFSDAAESPLPLTNNMRMTLKNAVGNPVHTLATTETPVDFQTERPGIVVSEDIGLVQLHIARASTNVLAVGRYSYDLFAMVDDEGIYAGEQAICLLRGHVVVHRRITESFD